MWGRAHSSASPCVPPAAAHRSWTRALAAWKVSSQPCAFFGNPPGVSPPPTAPNPAVSGEIAAAARPGQGRPP